MKTRIRLKRLASLLAFSSFVLTLLIYAFRIRPTQDALQSVRIAIPGLQVSALVILAEQKHFFQDHGIAPILIYKPLGKDCLDVLAAGEADYAQAFVTPIVNALHRGADIKILTELHRSQRSTAVIVRRDHHINSPKDLKGKRIGVTPGTNAEFALDLFLNSQLIPLNQITTVHGERPHLVDALLKGELNALAIWEPFLSQMISVNPRIFAAFRTSFYSEFSALVGNDTSTAQHALVAKIMKSLEAAESYYQEQPKEAQAIVTEALQEHGFESSSTAWLGLDIRIGMSATFRTMLHEESTWALKKINPSLPKAGNYDLNKTIHAHILKRMKPDSVTYL